MVGQVRTCHTPGHVTDMSGRVAPSPGSGRVNSSRPPTSWGIAWRVVAILVGLFLLLVTCSVLSSGPHYTDRPGLVEPDIGFEDVQFCG